MSIERLAAEFQRTSKIPFDKQLVEEALRERQKLVEACESVLFYAELLSDLQALSGDPERALRKMRGHLAGVVVDARLALGMPAFPAMLQETDKQGIA